MQTFLFSLVLLTLVGLFFQNFVKLQKDAEAGPAELTLAEWFKHSVVEMALNFVLFVAMCLKLDLNSLVKAASTVAQSAGTFTEVTSIGGAIATGLLIFKTVQLTLLPTWNFLTGATTARRKLRNKVSDSLK